MSDGKFRKAIISLLALLNILLAVIAYTLIAEYNYNIAFNKKLLKEIQLVKSAASATADEVSDFHEAYDAITLDMGFPLPNNKFKKVK